MVFIAVKIHKNIKTAMFPFKLEDEARHEWDKGSNKNGCNGRLDLALAVDVVGAQHGQADQSQIQKGL